MILITGGAGYIGSHVAKQLLENKEKIIILDNLSTGSLKTIRTLKKIYDFEFINEDLKNFDKIEDIFKNKDIKTVIHFAASIVVSESVKYPMKYYLNNTVNTANLVNLISKYNVEKLIFSSTAAVYGEPSKVLDSGIDENYDTHPINPYGMSKLMSENIIKDTCKTSSFKYIIFRYFNVAGADMHYEDGILKPRIGQCSEEATHLIKIASECSNKRRKSMNIYGDTYETKDGTCLRDYVHVDDLSNAHIKAINFLDSNSSEIFNIGYGLPTSVKQVIVTMKEVSQTNFEVFVKDKRSGDPSILVSNNNKILNLMKWVPKYYNIKTICESSFMWDKKGLEF